MRLHPVNLRIDRERIRDLSTIGVKKYSTVFFISAMMTILLVPALPVVDVVKIQPGQGRTAARERKEREKREAVFK